MLAFKEPTDCWMGLLWVQVSISGFPRRASLHTSCPLYGDSCRLLLQEHKHTIQCNFIQIKLLQKKGGRAFQVLSSYGEKMFAGAIVSVSFLSTAFTQTTNILTGDARVLRTTCTCREKEPPFSCSWPSVFVMDLSWSRHGDFRFHTRLRVRNQIWFSNITSK